MTLGLGTLAIDSMIGLPPKAMRFQQDSDVYPQVKLTFLIGFLYFPAIPGECGSCKNALERNYLK